MSARNCPGGKCKRNRALVQERLSAMQHAVSILRVSTKKQLTAGEGIENQRRGNDAYIGQKRYKLHREFVLAESADDTERTDFEGVLRYIVEHKHEIDVVVFWKMDRISRAGVGTYYALKSYLAKHGVRIEFATEQIDASPVGELMESLLAATARFENRLRVDRTIGVEKILTKDGYWCRAAPTGFLNARDKGGKPILRPDPERWGLLSYGLRKQLTGAYKPIEVARELRDKGLLSNRGNPLSKQSWEKICRSPVYGGMIGGVWIDGQLVRAKFEGPLTPEEWHRLQQVLDGRNTIARRRPRKALNPEFPLRRFLRCPQCDSPVRGYPAVKKNGKRFCYYDCKNAACRFRVPVEKAHRMFVDFLGSMAPAPAVLDTFRRVVLDTWEEVCRELRTESTALQRTVTALREEKESLVELMKKAKGDDSLLEILRRDFERVDREVTLATLDRNQAEIREYEAEAVVGHCTYFLEHASELWKRWPVDGQSHLQLMAFPEGLSFAVLEGKQTAKRSVIYQAIANLPIPDAMAAPSYRMTNRILSEMVGWYRLLRTLPTMRGAITESAPPDPGSTGGE